MNHASLFSGIGGPEIAAEMIGWQNVFHCEINPFCRAILDFWFPESASYEDITKTDFTKWRGRIDVLTGGFPCQPFSYAGNRRGESDDRYLWPEMLRAIEEIRPTWVIGENVAGIATMVEGGRIYDLGAVETLFQTGNDFRRYKYEQSYTIERICTDFENIGYSVQPFVVPAACVNAPHKRERIFIVANADGGFEMRTPGKDAGTGKKERLQERDEIREFGKPNYVPTGISGSSSDAKNVFGYGDKIGHKGKFCGQEIPEFGNSCGENPFTDPNGPGYEKPVKIDKQKNTTRNRTGLGDRIERLGCSWWFPGTKFKWGDMFSRKRWKYRGGKWVPTVPAIHRGNDGIPFPLDCLAIPESKWRTESLKAYGNAIVPQVMYRIFQAIEFAEANSKTDINF